MRQPLCRGALDLREQRLLLRGQGHEGRGRHRGPDFATIDADHDGAVTVAELAAVRPPGPPPGGPDGDDDRPPPDEPPPE